MNYEELTELGNAERERKSAFRNRIFCCTSTACLSTGANQVIDALHLSVEACQCGEDEAEVVKIGCMGLCSRGPMVRVESQDGKETLYADVDAAVAQQIVAEHIPITKSERTAGKDVDAHDFAHYRSQLRDAKQRKGTKTLSRTARPQRIAHPRAFVPLLALSIMVGLTNLLRCQMQLL